MSDQTVSGGGSTGFAHRVLECLTSLKLRVGMLRLRVRLGTIAPEEMESHLARIEHEIDATAQLAHDVQTAGGESSRA